MIKYGLFVVSFLWLTSCSAHDDNYYRVHPKELQERLQQCAAQETSSCEELKTVAADINQLAYDLQTNPQQFGLKIMSLQWELVKKKDLLAQSSDKSALDRDLALLEQQLAMRLALVKWLESPES